MTIKQKLVNLLDDVFALKGEVSGGGEGNDNIIEVVCSLEDIEAIMSSNSDYINATQSGNIGALNLCILSNGNITMWPIMVITDSFEETMVVRFFFINISQYTGNVTLYMCFEYNNYFHANTIDNSFDISPEQKTYYLGSLKNSEPEPDSGSTEK